MYSERDLEDLREIAENVPEDGDATCGTSTPSVHVSSVMCITAAAAILVMYILI